MKYEAIPPLDRLEVEAAIKRNIPEELGVALLAASLHSEDHSWAEGLCLRLASHPAPNVRGSAVLGFGHIARIHGSLSEAAATAIEVALGDDDPTVRGQADDAADDLESFLGWTITRTSTGH